MARNGPYIVGPQARHYRAGWPYKTQKGENTNMGTISGGTKSRPLAKSPKPSKALRGRR